MKIDQIEIYHAVLKLKQPFITSLGYRDQADNVFVRVRTDQGIDGWGECSPYPPINGETVKTCFVIGELLGHQLIGRNPSLHEENSDLMDSVIFGNTSIKSALDIAMHDLAAKADGLPLYKYLGGEITKTIHTDYTVSIAPVKEMVANAIKVQEAGFPVMKVKLGNGGPLDVERIKAIRDAVGYNIKIRIDANQGWKIKEAITALEEMSPYNIQYCEEPINKRNYFRLKKVKNNSPIKIMADECLSDHYDASKLIKWQLCDHFNIKLGKSSGLVKAQKIIKEAEEAAVHMQIGGFLESRLLFTANCHLAHTSDMVKYYDFDSPLFMQEDPIMGGMEYQQDWEITLPDSPGLGVDVDPTFLEKSKSIFIK